MVFLAAMGTSDNALEYRLGSAANIRCPQVPQQRVLALVHMGFVMEGLFFVTGDCCKLDLSFDVQAVAQCFDLKANGEKGGSLNEPSPQSGGKV